MPAEDWRLLTPATLFELPEGASRAGRLAFRVPVEALPGTYQVRYGVRGRADPSAMAGELFLITVRDVPRLRSVVTEAPQMVIAGRPFVATLQITNDGNATVRARSTWT